MAAGKFFSAFSKGLVEKVGLLPPFFVLYIN